MGMSNYVDAETIEKQDNLESQDVNIVIFINVDFSLLAGSRMSTEKNESINPHIAIADMFNEHVCYCPPIKMMDYPDRIFSHNIFVPCADLLFCEDGSLLEPEEVYDKIVNTCIDVVNFLDNLNVQPGSNVQVRINITGFDFVSDFVFGLALITDENCPNLIEDEVVREIVLGILDEYEPLFQNFLNSGWDIKVANISILEHSIVFESGNDFNSSTSVIDPKNIVDNTKEDCDVITKDNIIRKKEYPQITRYGHVEKNDFDNVSFCFEPLYQIKKIVFPSLYYLDKYVGAEDVEKDILSNIYNSVKAHYEGDKSKEIEFLKKTGFAIMDYMHIRLDVISFIPAIGSVSSLVDSLIYAIQADIAFYNGGELNGISYEDYKKEVAINLIFAIPFVKLGKYGGKFVKLGKGIKEIRLINIIKETKNIEQTLIKTGKRLRKKRPKFRRNKKGRIRKRKWGKGRKQASMENAFAKDQKANMQKNAAKVGMSYEEISSLSRTNLYELLKQIANSNLLFEDLSQSVIKQYIDPYSTTQKNLKQILPFLKQKHPQNNKNDKSK